MKLGFVSAILPDLSLEEVVELAATDEGSLARRRAAPRQGRQFLSQFLVFE